MTYDKEIAKRFLQFRKAHIAPYQKTAAEMLKCNQSKISRIEDGTKAVDFYLVAKMIQHFGLNAEWLATGKGSMKLKEEAKGNLVTNLNDFKADLQVIMKAIRMLQANQTYVMRVVEEMQNKQSQDRLQQN